MEFPVLTVQKREFLNRATQTYYEQLKTSNVAIDYLKSRGFDGESTRSLKLGFVQEPVENHQQMEGMLAIPFITPTGVVAIRFRRISGDGNKYHQETGPSSPLYNVRDFHRPEPFVALCEGEFDAAVLSALVGVPAVGLPGTGQWAKQGKFWRRLFMDYDRVFVVMDPDDSGQKAAALIMKAIPNAVNIILPFDVNDTFLTHGKEFLLKELGLWKEPADLTVASSVT